MTVLSRPRINGNDAPATGRGEMLVDLRDASDDTLNVGVRPSWEYRYIAVLMVADLAAALMAVAICWALRPSDQHNTITVLNGSLPYAVLALFSMPVWLGVLALCGAYRPESIGQGFGDYRVPTKAAIRLVALVAIAAFALKVALSRSLVVTYFPSLIVASILLRGVTGQGLSIIRQRGHALRQLVLVGDEPSVRKFATHVLRHAGHGYEIVGACVPGTTRSLDIRDHHIPVIGTPDEMVVAARTVNARAVAVVGHARFEQVTLQQVAWRLERSGVDLLVAPDVVDMAGPRIRVSPLTGIPLLHITEPRIGGRGWQVKGYLERGLSLPMLIVLSPILLIAALAILIDSGRPVFYRQRRVGYRGVTFKMIKFRTMVRDADERLPGLLAQNEHQGVLFKIRDDPRVTRVGAWLRRHSIDELPQLFNVLKGDMVLIGPRPVLAREVESFDEEAAHRRFLARPGMTGLWQVSGRSDLPWSDAVRLDLHYVENWSVLGDLRIMWRTVSVVVRPVGAY